MIRPLVVLLLLLNLGLMLWGWTHDVPIVPRLPPLAQGPWEIRLASEAPKAVPEAGEALPSRPAPDIEDVGRSPPPVSANDVETAGPALQAPKTETRIERVDPGSLPYEMAVEPPVVTPPVREDPPGPVRTWSQGRDLPASHPVRRGRGGSSD